MHDLRTLRTTDLDELLARRDGPCVSIYMPTHRKGPDKDQDRIRFENLLKKAEAELKRIAVPHGQTGDVLAAARALLPERDFWEHQQDGLAVFLAPGFTRFWRLPVPFGELVVVSGAFHVKRLLPLVIGDGRFYVLALSQNHVRLLAGTRHSVTELDARGVPKSLADALWMDDPEKSLQSHGGPASPSTGRQSAIFHGHGAAADAEKTNLLRYFRRVDEGMREYLKDGFTPLVLAGVEHYFPIYREASKYAHLMDQGVPGSPDRLTAEELHDRAWAIVEPTFLRESEQALDRYRQDAGRGRTSQTLEEIVPAAHHGRVDALFVASGRQCWGAFIPDAGGSVILHESYEQGDQDLLDVAAAATLRTGGRVFPLSPDQLPTDAPVAALYRY